LILGEGDGRFLHALLRANPHVAVDCVDGSAEMLALARARVGEDAHRVRFFVAEASAWRPERRDYDLVVTHFFFDCLAAPEVEAIIDELAAASASHATWLLADFTIPKGRWRSIHARAWLSVLYSFFRATAGIRTSTLVDPVPLLEAHGYRCTQRFETRFGMLCSTSWRRAQRMYARGQ
jgi:ubiquinone/menaquinone biosynthesis C-methylase UbiE